MAQANRVSETKLRRQPEARGFRVEQLLQEARDGRLRIPAFQRPLRWRSKNVIELFDSIRRGFPVGELLLSKYHAKADTVTYGPYSIDAEDQASAYWVVDGQQRITALVATLLRPEETPRGDFWAIWYDLENEEFRLLLKRDAEPTWMPLNVLCDSVKQLKWIRNWPYADDHEVLVDRALELGKSIREFEMPAYIVEAADEHVLRLIFTRVNTGGIGMRESEIFEALYGNEGDKPIRSAVARLCDLGFGQLDEDLFLRCLRVTCDVPLRDSIDSPEKLPKDSIRRTESALRRTITAISLAAGVPHWKLLPYRLPLVCLPAFYDRFPSEDSRMDRLVAKWIWRGALTGDHEDVTDARVTRLVKQIRDAETSSEAIVGLLSHFESLDTDGDFKNSPLNEIEQKISLSRASGKIFVLGLLAANPRRGPTDAQQLLWTDDIEDEVEQASNSSAVDPSKVYRSLTDEGNIGIDTIVRVSGMGKKELICADAETLRSFLLNAEAVEFLAAGSVEDFRSCRRIILTAYFTQFVADRVGDRIDVRPSIRAIIEESVT
ncbi:MAG: DUF262 domain-containing protein [Planctomycetaceae bacterium]|nr:DUF262 domain-containing protein [Planctomycetales bacterium]MCB9926444.1 DUF262 domain-containing protein [Planctomycetaceae bacterium]